MIENNVINIMEKIINAVREFYLKIYMSMVTLYG